MIAELLTSSLLFLGGLSKDGTCAGLGYRSVGFEIQSTYMSVPKSIYAIKNPLDIGSTIPSDVVLRPLLGRDRLAYSTVAIRIFKTWDLDWLFPVDVGVGNNFKLWIWNHRDVNPPYEQGSIGPSAFVSLYASRYHDSGVRLMMDLNMDTKVRKPAAEFVLTFVIGIDPGWEPAPEIPYD